MHRRLTFWAAMVLVAALVLTGCAPRTGAGTSADMADENELVIDLPAIVIDFDSNGGASIGGVPVAEMGAMAGVDLSTLSLPGDWVNYFSLSNIQHLQVNNGAEGLTILVNGEPVPSLVWDEMSLVATADTVSALGIMIPVLDKVLPLVQQLGVGVVLRFPVQAGMDLIPMMVEGDGSAAEEARAAQEEFLDAVGTPPRISLPVVYDANGSYTVGDLTDVEWQQLTGIPWAALRLDQGTLGGLANAGVTSMSFETDTEGIHISINGNHLPSISWGNGEVQHVLDLVQQMGILDTMALGASAEVMDTIESLLPVVQTADANISVFFPGSSMGN